ncbi:MAG: DNA polymerase III subunit delta [Candidatus Saccharimonadales bacterium]
MAGTFITLSGDNIFALKQELAGLTREFSERYGDLAIERLDGEESELAVVRSALNSSGLLAERKLVILGSPSRNKQISDAIEDMSANLPDTTDVVVLEPQLDKRLSIYKALNRVSDFRTFRELDASALGKWLQETAKKGGGSISSADASYLVERVGPNQQLLSKEMEKLLIHNPQITRQSINMLTDRSAQSTIFQLLDAAFSGDKSKTLQLYEEQRSMKTEPAQIIALIAWQLHILSIIKAAGDRSTNMIAKEAKINPYSLSRSVSVANKLTLRRIKSLISRLAKIDVDIKSRPIDADEALTHYLITLS